MQLKITGLAANLRMTAPFTSLLQLQRKVIARIQPAKTQIVCPCPSVSSTCITVTQLPAGDRAQYGGEQYRLLTGLQIGLCQVSYASLCVTTLSGESRKRRSVENRDV